MNPNEINTLIYKVLIKGDERADLIKFYNIVYLAQMKPYLNSLSMNRQQGETDSKSYTPFLKRPVIPALAVASPLKESLPQSNSALRMKSPMVRAGMTPTATAVYAFGESPSRALEKINGELASKRIIDFEEGAQDSDQKKKKYINPVLERIMDQRHEESEDSQKKSIYCYIDFVPY